MPNRTYQLTGSRARRRGNRRGSALLVCMLAAAVIALSATALLRAQHRSSLRTQAVLQSAADQEVALGLAHCAIARLRADPSLRGNVTDADFGDQVRATISLATPNEVQISVWLYPTALQPAYSLQLDPTTL